MVARYDYEIDKINIRRRYSDRMQTTAMLCVIVSMRSELNKAIAGGQMPHTNMSRYRKKNNESNVRNSMEILK